MAWPEARGAGPPRQCHEVETAHPARRGVARRRDARHHPGGCRGALLAGPASPTGNASEHAEVARAVACGYRENLLSMDRRERVERQPGFYEGSATGVMKSPARSVAVEL